MNASRIFFLSIITLGVISLGIICALLEYPFFSLQSLIVQPDQKGSIVFDDQGNILYRYEKEKQIWVSFNDIPEVVINAFITAEDRAFFSHRGISWKGILRSLIVNIIQGKLVQGASTITQQLIRLLFLSQKRTFFRKIKEIFMALSLEKKLSKEQIMELYVNNIYFGRGIYGIEAASQRFWHKSVCFLNAAEGATLAAIAKSARFYSPLNDPKRSTLRRNTILFLMHKEGYITHTQCKEAQQLPLIEVTMDSIKNPIEPYYKEWIRYWCEQQWGHDLLYTGNLNIHTTLNQQIQKAAESIFNSQLTILRTTEDPLLNGGLITIDGKTGAIKATIGGFNFKESQFNRCFQAYRQLGSTFKPFVYAAALLHEIPLTTCDVDEPWSTLLPNKTVWEPHNWNKTHAGSMSLARALVHSNNIIAAKLLLKIGYEPLLSIAKKAGLWKELKPIPALSLGTVEGTVEEVAGAFNIFAHHGIYTKPFLISCVKNSEGKTLFEHKPEKTRALDACISDQINSVLKHQITILDQRTETQQSAVALIGKTGSTNDAKSMWFVGSSPSYTTAVYIGRDDNNRGTHKKLASKTAYPLWRLLQDQLPHPIKTFTYTTHLSPILIDAWTGTTTHQKTKDTITILKPLT